MFEIPRNSECPCGSGVKYKKCCRVKADALGKKYVEVIIGQCFHDNLRILYVKPANPAGGVIAFAACPTCRQMLGASRSRNDLLGVATPPTPVNITGDELYRFILKYGLSASPQKTIAGLELVA